MWKYVYSESVFNKYTLRQNRNVQQNAWTLWPQNVIIPFKIKTIEKPHTVLLPDLWFLSCNKKFWNSMISARVGAP